MKQLKKNLSQRLREERHKRNWSIEELSEKIDMAPSSLGLVERGDRLLSVEKLHKVASVFGVSVDSLLNIPTDTDITRVDSIYALVSGIPATDFKCILEVIRCLKQQLNEKI